MKRFWTYAFVGFLFIIAGIYFSAQKSAPIPNQVNAADKLFVQSLPDLKGQPQALKQWQGKPLLVNFWATWCAPCVEEMPELSALQTEIAPKNIQIIGIGIDSADNIIEFSTKYKITYPLYVAGATGTGLMQGFGKSATGLPFTVLIGADGQIKKTYLGRLEMAEVRADLAAL